MKQGMGTSAVCRGSVIESSKENGAPQSNQSFTTQRRFYENARCATIKGKIKGNCPPVPARCRDRFEVALTFSARRNSCDKASGNHARPTEDALCKNVVDLVPP